jgi:hypothetical protein
VINARFWVYANDSLVKLTLKPGQVLRHVEGGYTDEGYSWTETRWEYDDFDCKLLRSKTTESRDCDGRMDYFSEYECGLIELNYSRDGEEDYPDWKVLHRSQRDYSAEAAGY